MRDRVRNTMASVWNMPADDVPGQRTGVDKYDVAIHMKR